MPLNGGGVGGAGRDPLTCKMGTFFMMFLTLIQSIFISFQLNWKSFKIWDIKNVLILPKGKMYQKL